MPLKTRRSSFIFRLSRWRWWLARLVIVLGAPLLFLGALEAGLRLLDYGYPTTFFVKAGDGANEIVNPHFTAPFFPPDAEVQPWPVLLPMRKTPGTLRIFILGESAAHGTPDPSFGFARILEVMLRHQYPNRRFEVVNAALRGINSHLILPIARECAAREPDLFIAYLGNNEVTGLYAPEPGAWNVTPHLRLLRLMQQARTTRTAQLLQAGLRHASSPHPEAAQDMEFFRARRLAADDPRRLAVTDNFRENLRNICDTILAGGARAIVSTVTVNLHDCPPLASLHRTGLSPADAARWEELYAEGVTAESVEDYDLAIHRYIGAAFIDDHFAELQFRIARCYHAIRHDVLQHGEYARMRYALACDWDALQFRADGHLNTIIREISTNREAEGLFLADAAQAFTVPPWSQPLWCRTDL